MKNDERAAAVHPDQEIAGRVRRYERFLFNVLRQRPAEDRAKPITNDEHLLAAQAEEATTAYERSLRRVPLPPAPARKDEEPAPEPAKPPKAVRRAPVRRRKRARRKAPQEAATTPQEG